MDQIVRIFDVQAWPDLEGKMLIWLALAMRHVLGGNARRVTFSFVEDYGILTAAANLSQPFAPYRSPCCST